MAFSVRATVIRDARGVVRGTLPWLATLATLAALTAPAVGAAEPLAGFPPAGAVVRAPFDAAAPGAPVESVEAPGMASALALGVRDAGAAPVAAAVELGAPAGGGLGAGRAMILLRSLTVPGWGQATLGRKGAATLFFVAEAGVWGAFTAFRVQERLRQDSYENTASLLAGIDMKGRDEEFRRIVGSYLSSEEYNQYVVARDAANLFYDDPARMRAYIDEHALKGGDAWAWKDVESLLRYRRQRQDAQRAEKRANTALAVAVANRVLSAAHAARLAGRGVRPSAWKLEVAPAPGDDPTAYRVALTTRF